MESQVNSKFLLAVVGSPCFKDPPSVLPLVVVYSTYYYLALFLFYYVM
jgi:hypothetical protein